ncbi:MAG: MBL fold metallo-hydrolase [Calditrichaeota bacterium]|nr:MAG: MBL fold metallo-hydrolase [Calditrichota bacterium]
MDITILGSGVCAVTVQRSCSCYCIQVDGLYTLFDIGFGALRRLAEAGIFYGDIDAVLCSHLHLDHIGDLAPLLMSLNYTPTLRRQKPLTLFGPPGFQDFMYRCCDLYGNWLLSPASYSIIIHEMSEKEIRLGSLIIRAMPMKHTKNAIGYRVKTNDAIIAYSGDTALCNSLVELCRDADVAIVECSFPDEQPTEYHLTPREAASAAQQANVRQLILTHFYPPVDENRIISAAAQFFHGNIILAEDLKRISIHPIKG